MAAYKMLDGNAAAVEAMRMARVQVISAYPITPQSSIAEKLSDLVDQGKLDAKYIRVESEHTAMSAAIGAQLTGVRAATATSSVGLLLMAEVLGIASGCRMPIVMPVVNRALVSPWSLWCDHQDTMTVRDTGWLQLYCENVQDVYDLVICAYRAAEDARVQTPAMVCLDGFFLSHSMQKLSIPEQAEIDGFIGPYTPKNTYLNPLDPIIINNLTPSDELTEMRYQQALGFEAAGTVLDETFAEFEKLFGRRHERVEGYRMEDAQYAVVTLGSMSGTAKYVVDKLREEGVKAGALKVVCFRPFPSDLVKSALAGVKSAAVVDRTAGLGAQGAPLWTEVSAAMAGHIPVKGYIAGLGGRDISMYTLENVFRDLIASNDTREPVWIDLKGDPTAIRQVEMNV
ncbi:MAG: pyruvate ferredoxin oxidoreductase [Clostridia bacterium]|nr:pyruvate ferredoxin oxidoreductase [Clostridia bacterium]